MENDFTNYIRIIVQKMRTQRIKEVRGQNKYNKENVDQQSHNKKQCFCRKI
jgi:hypothetical protein